MKVLIPVQDAVFGDAITDMVTKHNWTSDTEFRLLTVLEYPTYGDMLDTVYCCDTMETHYAKQRQTAGTLLEQYVSKLKKVMPNARIETSVEFGDPKTMILNAAETWHSDIIVMGSHARKGLSRFLLGSVSMAVLSHSPCSVIIVKLPQQQKQGSRSSEQAAAGAAG